MISHEPTPEVRKAWMDYAAAVNALNVEIGGIQLQRIDDRRGDKTLVAFRDPRFQYVVHKILTDADLCDSVISGLEASAKFKIFRSLCLARGLRRPDEVGA